MKVTTTVTRKQATVLLAAFALAISLPLPTAESTSRTFYGEFYDDVVQLHGAATATLEATASTVSGSLDLAGFVGTFVVTFLSQVDTGGLEDISAFEGTATFNNRTLQMVLFDVGAGTLYQGWVKLPQIGVVFFTLGQNSAFTEEVVNAALATRTAWQLTTNYSPPFDDPSQEDAPDTTLPILQRPVLTPRPIIAGLSAPLEPAASSSDQGSRWADFGPRNEDFENDALGERMYMNALTEFRNQDILRSYDELEATNSPSLQELTMQAYMPVMNDDDVLGKLYLEAYLPGTSPIEFTQVGLNPIPGQSFPAHFLTTIAQGMGPIGSIWSTSMATDDVEVDFQEDHVAIKVTCGFASTRDCEATSPDQMWGFRVGLGARSTQSPGGFWQTAVYGAFSYGRVDCTWFLGDCAMSFFLLQSGNWWHYYATQVEADGAWDPCNNNTPECNVAIRDGQSVDFDMGDRTPTNCVDKSVYSMTICGPRAGYYSIPSHGTKTIYLWHTIWGPSCSDVGHELRYEILIFSTATQRWERLGTATEELPPIPHDCLPIWFSAPEIGITNQVAEAQYLVKMYIDNAYVDDMTLMIGR